MANRFLVMALGLLGLYGFFQFHFYNQDASVSAHFTQLRQGQNFEVKDVVGTNQAPAAAPIANPNPPSTNLSTVGDANPAPDAGLGSVQQSPGTQPAPVDNTAAPMVAENTTPMPTQPPVPVVDQVVTPVGTTTAVPVESTAIVLGYHQFVGPTEHSSNVYCMRADVFESEMAYLKDNGYNVVPLSDIVKFVQHQAALPPRAVAITIDDGYVSPIKWAAPILKKYNFPWTFFVYPDFINASVKAASWKDLLDLQNAGVDIECHSFTHPIMTRKAGKTPEQYDAFLNHETLDAKKVLEGKLGRPVNYFAYPYGDYNKVVQQKVIDAGFTAIFTVAGNPVHSSTPVFDIGRFIITKVEEKSFESILREGALALTNPLPAPGSVVNDPRPSISAILTYFGKIKPKSVSAEIHEMGGVACDYDPSTSTVRVYLQHDLVREEVSVTVHAQDAENGQHISATWRFNYEPTSANAKTPEGGDTSKIPVAPIAKPN